MAHVVNKTQNFELPFSWITLIQEGFQITLTKSGMDLLLPPYHATTVPGSSTSKHGSGAEIGASSQSCSLVDDGALALMIVTLEALRVQQVADVGGLLPLPLYDAYICSILEGFVPLYHHEALSSCFWSFDAAAVKASDFVLLFVAVSLSRSQLSISVGCFMEISLHGSLPAGMFFILQRLDALYSLICHWLLELCFWQVLSNVDGFGLASWFYLVAAFADLDVLLHLSGVAQFWFAKVVGVVACFAAMHPVSFVLDFGYPAVVALLFLDMLLFLKLAGYQLDILLAVESAGCWRSLSTLRSDCGMILAAGLLGLLELRIAPATPTANPICKRESEIRSLAEVSLRQASLQPGFRAALSKVAAKKGTSFWIALGNCRTIEAIYQESFEPPAVVTEEKGVIRRLLLPSLDDSHRKICTVISMAIASIAVYD
ncbi:hypothetical protein NC653_018207 [Populus alba x Populus x berolinensis]|uniref:Uncharacterized protein n=1 Tax=Populus alba x Populus x berolinensis TaxID=444605 RepID=A0AAD6QG16_9ROSI|nr:hypothetical protein NC653_018207 [Populus alba x Populus x berolinensis]